MATNTAPVTVDDSWEHTQVYVNGEFQEPKWPLMLKSQQVNEFKIVGESLVGAQIRIGVVSDGEPPTVFTPAADEWQSVGEDGTVTWSINPGTIEGNLTFVVIGRDFTEVLEVVCHFLEGNHPWYTHSYFYVATPDLNGVVPHLGLVPFTAPGQFFIFLVPIGTNLLGKEIRLTGIGADDSAIVTPSGDQTMTEAGLMWGLKLIKKDPATAYVSARNITAGTRIGFIPTPADQDENRPEKSDYPEAVQNLLDSYKA